MFKSDDEYRIPKLSRTTIIAIILVSTVISFGVGEYTLTHHSEPDYTVTGVITPEQRAELVANNTSFVEGVGVNLINKCYCEYEVYRTTRDGGVESINRTNWNRYWFYNSEQLIVENLTTGDTYRYEVEIDEDGRYRLVLVSEDTSGDEIELF